MSGKLRLLSEQFRSDVKAVGIPATAIQDFFQMQQTGRLLEGPTRKPRHAGVFGTSTPTRKRFPHSTVHKCFKTFFRHARF